jgi:hypothetical protein
MTFNDISLKMLKAGFRRYRLYFFCNVLSVTLLYCFAAILTNPSFMDLKVVDSMISSNIIAPSVFVAVFMALFIPYTYRAFMRSRKQEYGILMVLGMSAREANGRMLLENCAVAGASLATGLALGTALSGFFFLFIRNVIGVSQLQWALEARSYGYTVALYAVTMLVTLAMGAWDIVKAQLSELIKEKFRPEKGRRTSPALCAAGAGLMAAAVPVMLMSGGEGLWFLGLGMISLGLFLVMTRAGGLGARAGKALSRWRQRHILGLSFVRQHNESTRRLRFIATWLIAFSVFFGGLAAVMYGSSVQNAMRYSPYDMAYAQIFGKNQVEDAEIQKLLAENGVAVQSVRQVDYLRNGAFNIFPASQANANFGCDYRIERGKFLSVFQYDLTDGYGHDLSAPEEVHFDCEASDLALTSSGQDVRILTNVNPAFADRTLVVSDADFSLIASGCRDYWRGTAKLYDFDRWEDSKGGVEAVQNRLLEANRVDQSEQRYFRASSRIEAYATARQSAEFLIFLASFVIALFLTAADVMIHFKIRTETEEERRMLLGLRRIGVTGGEMLEMIRFKNGAYFMPQAIFGLALGTFYSHSLSRNINSGWKATAFSLILGAPFVAFQGELTKKCSKRELDRQRIR